MDQGIDLKVFPIQQFSIKTILKDLYKRSIFSLMVEAGGTLAGAFLKEKCVQKVYFFYAPKILGAEAKPGVGPLGITSLRSAITFKNIIFERFADDFMIEASL